MADKRSTNGSKNGWGDVQFARFSWNKEIEGSYEEWIKNQAPDASEALTYLTGAGYRITFSPPDDNASCKCSATGTGKKNPNDGICITSWGNDPEDALLITLFKIEVVFEGKTAPVSSGGHGTRG